MLHSRFLGKARTILIGFAVVTGVVVVSQSMASATAEPVWGDGVFAEFAAGVLQSNGGAAAGSVSCWSPGNCVAVGGFSANNTGNYKPFTITSTNGVWGTPREAVFASGVQASYSESGFESVSCPSAGNCTAVGKFTTAAGRTAAFTMVYTNSTWGQAEPVVFPNGTQNATPDSSLVDVSCSSAGNCTAVGSYKNTADGRNAFAITSVNGTWGVPVTASFASGVEYSTPIASFNSVSCASAGNCTAAGAFTPSVSRFATEVFTMTSTNGTWGQARPVVFATGVQASEPDAWVYSVSCASDGNCTIGGYYATADFDYFAFTATSTSGTWGTAQPVSIPGARFSEIKDVVCLSAGNCTAVGDYSPSTGGTVTFAMSSTGGVWGSASTITFPNGVLGSDPTALPYNLSCASAGNCTTVGYFRNSAAGNEGFSVTSTNGTWGTARPATVLIGSQSGRRTGELRSVSCSPNGLCTAVGYMNNADSKPRPFMTSSSEAPPPTTTTTTTTLAPTTSTSPSVTTTLPAPALATISSLPPASTPIVADSSIAVGEAISVTFGGFTPFEYVQLVVASTPQVIGSDYADAQGFVTITGNLPSGLAAGSHTLAVYAPGSGIGFSQPITVSASTLPVTGSREDGNSQLALWALTLGIAVIVIARRHQAI
jgi:hypothetical protein